MNKDTYFGNGCKHQIPSQLGYGCTEGRNLKPCFSCNCPLSKDKLRVALLSERQNLPEHNYFGEVQNYHDYDLAIQYLKCGYYNEDDFEGNELLEGVVTDFDSTYSDYFE